MKVILFKVLALLNRILLPNFTKNRLNLSKASKTQMIIFGWKLYVTKQIINQ